MAKQVQTFNSCSQLEGEPGKWKIVWEGRVSEEDDWLVLLLHCGDAGYMGWEIRSLSREVVAVLTLEKEGLVVKTKMNPDLTLSQVVMTLRDACTEGCVEIVDDGVTGSDLSVSVGAEGSHYEFKIPRHPWTYLDKRYASLEADKLTLAKQVSDLKQNIEDDFETQISLRNAKSKAEFDANQMKLALQRLNEENDELKRKNTELSNNLNRAEKRNRDLTDSLTDTIRTRRQSQGSMSEQIQRLTTDLGEEVAKREALSVITKERVMRDGLKDWNSLPVTDDDGVSMFIRMLDNYANVTRDPWHLVLAQYLYYHHRATRDHVLHFCAEHHSLSPMVAWLLQDPTIDPNERSTFDDTPLHVAAFQNNLESAELLLRDHRVKKNLTNVFGLTPMVYALRNNYQSMASLLLKFGCETNIEGKTGLSIDEEKKCSVVEE